MVKIQHAKTQLGNREPEVVQHPRKPSMRSSQETAPRTKRRVIAPRGEFRALVRIAPVAHLPMISGRIPGEHDRIKEEFYRHDSDDDRKVVADDLLMALRGVAKICAVGVNESEYGRFDELAKANYPHPLDYDQFIECVKSWERDMLLTNYLESQVITYRELKGKSNDPG
jgi:hypothetical protein